MQLNILLSTIRNKKYIDRVLPVFYLYSIKISIKHRLKSYKDRSTIFSVELKEMKCVYNLIEENIWYASD